MHTSMCRAHCQSITTDWNLRQKSNTLLGISIVLPCLKCCSTELQFKAGLMCCLDTYATCMIPGTTALWCFEHGNTTVPGDCHIQYQVWCVYAVMCNEIFGSITGIMIVLQFSILFTYLSIIHRLLGLQFETVCGIPVILSFQLVY